MISAKPLEEGIQLRFADGCTGLIPYADIPEVGGLSNLTKIELPNPYLMVLQNSNGDRVEIPWDFARAFCDAAYQRRIEAIASAGRRSLGARIRRLREQAGRTQEAVAAQAGLETATLVRIEKGKQSPRYETLAALAQALGRPLADLLVGPRSV